MTLSERPMSGLLKSWRQMQHCTEAVKAAQQARSILESLENKRSRCPDLSCPTVDIVTLCSRGYQGERFFGRFLEAHAKLHKPEIAGSFFADFLQGFGIFQCLGVADFHRYRYSLEDVKF